jgi:DNA invertase Pin-like site-specific DNA recombinase
MQPQPSNQPPAALRAAIAARVSTVEQDREGKTSLDEQLDKARAEIERRGWTLDEQHIFVDRVSGDRLARFDQPLAAAHRHEFDAIVFTKINRLGRNLLDLVAIEEELRELGVGLVCLDNPFDTTTPAGRAQFQMMAVFSEWEKSNLLEQMANGVHALARRDPGRYIGGEVPFGLMVTGEKGDSNRRLVPNPAEVEVVRTAWDLLVNHGHTTWTAARELNARGLLPRKAARWDNVLLRAMLTKETLRGVQVWAKPPRPTWTKPARGERGRTATGKYGGPIEMTIPRVLEEEEWLALQAVLGASSTPTPLRSPEPFLLSGRGHQRLWAPCGSVMTGLHADGRSRRYRCMAKFKGGERACSCRRIDADLLELTVKTHILAMFSNPDQLTEAMHAWLEPEPTQPGLSTAEDLDARIAAAERKRTNLVLAAAEVGPEAIAEAVAQVETELQTLRRRQELRASALEQRAEVQARIPEIMRFVAKAASLDAQGWRSLLALMDVQVTITGWVEDYQAPTGGVLFPPWPFVWQIEGNIIVPQSGDGPAPGPCARRCPPGAPR